MWTCTRIYDDILFEYPLDSFALSMSYLTGLITAQKDLMRNIPARVVAEYSKSDRSESTKQMEEKLNFQVPELVILLDTQ